MVDAAIPTRGIAILEDAFPAVVTVSFAESDSHDIDVYLAKMNELYARRQKMVWLSVVTGSNNNREPLAKIGQWMKTNQTTLARYGAATAFVTQSTLFRFVLSGLLLFAPIPNGYHVFSSMDEAVEWLLGKAEAADVRVDRAKLLAVARKASELTAPAR